MLFVECKPDEALARKLGIARRDCKHHDDKGRVCKALQREEGVIAMVDEDPGSAQPRYLGALEQVSDADGIRVLRDVKRSHRVVVLRPRLEEWIISTATAAGVKMADFGLSDRGNELHREINSRLESFGRLLGALEAAQSRPLAELRRWIAG